MLGSFPVNGYEDHYTVTCRSKKLNRVVKLSGFDTIVLYGATVKHSGGTYVLMREVRKN